MCLSASSPVSVTLDELRQVPNAESSDWPEINPDELNSYRMRFPRKSDFGNRRPAGTRSAAPSEGLAGEGQRLVVSGAFTLSWGGESLLMRPCDGGLQTRARDRGHSRPSQPASPLNLALLALEAARDGGYDDQSGRWGQKKNGVGTGVATYDLRGLEADFVVHYGGESQQIDAYTFGNSLIALCDVLKAVNHEINPGYSVEVSVIALGGGSFRPQIKTRAKRLKSLLLHDFRSVVVQVVAALIIHRALGMADAGPTYEIKDSEVHIYEGGDVVILPKEAFEAYRRVEGSQDVNRGLRQAFEVVEEDEAVTSFGFARDPGERENLPFEFDRSRFADIARPRTPLAKDQREKLERGAEL